MSVMQTHSAEPALYERVREALDELRPNLQRDGGDCQLVSVEGNLVTVCMTGACVGCQLANLTLNGLQMKLIEKLGIPLRIATTRSAH